MNEFSRSGIQTIVKDVGDTISSTGDRLLFIPVGAIGSYSYGKVSTCGNTTAVANTLSLGQSTPIQHEWIQIKTNTHYYIVQIWVNGNILMEQKTSTQEVDQTGLYCANRPNNANVWTIDIHSISIQLGDIINWLKSEEFTPTYHWSKHNCQHFCKTFMNRFN